MPVALAPVPLAPVPASRVSTPARRVEDGEIICLGAARPVVSGSVDCPLASHRVRLAQCLDCHLLSWRSDERDATAPCSTDPAPN